MTWIDSAGDTAVVLRPVTCGLKGVGVGVLWMELLFLLLYAAIVFALATRKMNQKVA